VDIGVQAEINQLPCHVWFIAVPACRQHSHEISLVEKARWSGIKSRNALRHADKNSFAAAI
jgi:hypothetical protein